MTEKMTKRAQVAIYVIIALVIVGLTVTFFAMRGIFSAESVPAEFRPVFDFYQQCIADEVSAAISLAGTQGGWVYPAEYIPGSEYAPFSSQLNFLGFPVPYWYYIAGNGLIKENVPTKSEIENEIARYVNENLNERCNFGEFYGEGFEVNLSKPTVKVTISDASVGVEVNSQVLVSKEDAGSATKSSYSLQIPSKFGKLYSSALSIYDKEKKNSFLENYSIDVMWLYAPVDGVEIGCSGKVWRTRDVVSDLKNGLEANIAAIKFKGDYYTLANKEANYFVVDLPVDESVNMIYSQSWPTRIEIHGADDELMVAEPVGQDAGAGAMGFCYAPYHFVYDISYPVLIQVYDGAEIFQFPVIVVIDKNLPREGIYTGTGYGVESPDVCQFDTQDIEVNLYDTNLNRVDANISYNCFDQVCQLGESKDGTFAGKAPACVNGYMIAESGGYAKKKELFSTNEQSYLDMILDREYEVELQLEVGGKVLAGGSGLVVFANGKTASALLPDSPMIKLSEGYYNVSAYVYSNSSLTIPASSREQCSEVSKGGVGAFFGLTEEKCFTIEIPETKIEQALIGGGKSEVYLLPSDLEKGVLKMKVDSLPTPNSLEDMQSNYALFEEMHVEVDYA